MPAQTIQPTNETLEILNKVDQFYQSSWNNLVLTASVMLAILAVGFGIIMPLVINYFQKKNNALDRDQLKKEIQQEIEKVKNELKQDISDEYKTELNRINNLIQTKSEVLEAISFQIQGNLFLTNNLKKDALESFFKSMLKFSKAKDVIRFVQVCDYVIEKLSSLIVKKELVLLFENMHTTKEQYLLDCKKHSQESQLILSKINDLTKAINKLD